MNVSDGLNEEKFQKQIFKNSTKISLNWNSSPLVSAFIKTSPKINLKHFAIAAVARNTIISPWRNLFLLLEVFKLVRMFSCFPKRIRDWEISQHMEIHFQCRRKDFSSRHVYVCIKCLLKLFLSLWTYEFKLKPTHEIKGQKRILVKNYPNVLRTGGNASLMETNTKMIFYFNALDKKILRRFPRRFMTQNHRLRLFF